MSWDCRAAEYHPATEYVLNDSLALNWRNLHRQGLQGSVTRAGMISDTAEPFFSTGQSERWHYLQNGGEAVTPQRGQSAPAILTA